MSADEHQVDTTPFLRWLRRRGLSESTARSYARTIRLADRRAAAMNQRLADVDLPELDNLVGLWPRTRASRQLLRVSLFRWWEYIGRADPPAAAIRVPSKPRARCRAMAEADAVALERSARADRHPAGLAVLFGLYCGLRRSEIAALHVDMFGEPGWLHVVGKGDRSRDIPLHATLLDELAARRPPAPWLFPGPGGRGHICPATVGNWLRRVAAAAGVDAVSPHVLRHTALATAHDRTGDLRAVQALAGHARPETTAVYTRTTTKALVAAVTAIDYAAAAQEAS